VEEDGEKFFSVTAKRQWSRIDRYLTWISRESKAEMRDLDLQNTMKNYYIISSIWAAQLNG
jgi:hypothetical protein